jgi:hypothetical protein
MRILPSAAQSYSIMVVAPKFLNMFNLTLGLYC